MPLWAMLATRDSDRAGSTFSVTRKQRCKHAGRSHCTRICIASYGEAWVHFPAMGYRAAGLAGRVDCIHRETNFNDRLRLNFPNAKMRIETLCGKLPPIADLHHPRLGYLPCLRPLPISVWKSLRSGSIVFQERIIRRSRQPIRFWLVMLTIVAFFLWKSFQLDIDLVVKPLWHLMAKR